TQDVVEAADPGQGLAIGAGIAGQVIDGVLAVGQLPGAVGPAQVRAAGAGQHRLGEVGAIVDADLVALDRRSLGLQCPGRGDVAPGDADVVAAVVDQGDGVGAS